MRLLVELARERGTPALVNIHDVNLAQTYADRVIGLAGGKIRFDGGTNDITHDVLTEIYGEEDWSATIQQANNDKTTENEGADKVVRESVTG